MDKHLGIISGICLGLATLSTGVLAADQTQTREQLQTQDQLRTQTQLQTQDRLNAQDKEMMNSPYMTEQERNQYRERIQNANMEQERERIRQQQQMQLQERAMKHGASSPATQPPHGMSGGKGPGGGGKAR